MRVYLNNNNRILHIKHYNIVIGLARVGRSNTAIGPNLEPPRSSLVNVFNPQIEVAGPLDRFFFFVPHLISSFPYNIYIYIYALTCTRILYLNIIRHTIPHSAACSSFGAVYLYVIMKARVHYTFYYSIYYYYIIIYTYIRYTSFVARRR